MFHREKGIAAGHGVTTEVRNHLRDGDYRQCPKQQRQPQLVASWRRRRTLASKLNMRGVKEDFLVCRTLQQTLGQCRSGIDFSLSACNLPHGQT